MTDFSAVEHSIEIVFKDKRLLEKVFIHRSYLNEYNEASESNERLEFLGDAVLELVATEFLYKKYTRMTEGELTAVRSALVRREHLAVAAKQLDLGTQLLLSRGEALSGGSQKDYILANTVEALIGAVYLDQGMQTATKFINKYLLHDVEDIVAQKLYVDSKSKFQEIAQDLLAITPHYSMIADEGPDHDKKFIMGLFLHHEKVAEGTGTSKRKAEEDAAYNGLVAKGWL